MVGEREIVIPHDPAAGPVTAVKNVLLQSSLSQLRQNGHYDRYVALVDPRVLDRLTASLGPGWIPIEVADAHYAACDALTLTNDEIASMGNRVGDRVQEKALVSASRARPAAEFDLWTEAVRPLHRMWARVYQGGSVQVTKLGPRIQQTELRGFGLVRHRYFRQATVHAAASAYSAMGALIDSIKAVSHDVATGELAIRMSWL